MDMVYSLRSSLLKEWTSAPLRLYTCFYEVSDKTKTDESRVKKPKNLLKTTLIAGRSLVRISAGCTLTGPASGQTGWNMLMRPEVCEPNRNRGHNAITVKRRSFSDIDEFNVFRFLYNDEIYYRTVRSIPSGTELLSKSDLVIIWR